MVRDPRGHGPGHPALANGLLGKIKCHYNIRVWGREGSARAGPVHREPQPFLQTQPGGDGGAAAGRGGACVLGPGQPRPRHLLGSRDWGARPPCSRSLDSKGSGRGNHGSTLGRPRGRGGPSGGPSGRSWVRGGSPGWGWRELRVRRQSGQEGRPLGLWAPGGRDSKAAICTDDTQAGACPGHREWPRAGWLGPRQPRTGADRAGGRCWGDVVRAHGK